MTTFAPLPAGPFDVALVDPPWLYYGSPDKWAAAGKVYALLDDAALAAMPVRDLLHPRSVVFLWATGPRLDAAVALLAAWGLAFRGVGFVWVKCARNGQPIGARGVRPSIVKPTTEFVLCGSPCKRGRPLPVADESVRQVVLAPVADHSRKPDEVHERIETLYPNASRVELFARRPRVGWTTWGNELPAVEARA
jgi:N6-adenosine-specific RNA methylase IME4